MNNIIVNNIVKHYAQVEALKGVSLEVNEGELFGLIGPDGAGKTSLFRILTTLLLPDDGEAEVCGYDIRKDYKAIRQIVGYMPGQFSLYQDLSVEENIDFFATVFNTSLQENYDLIKDIYVQLEPFKKRKAGKLSGGMKQKLALCCALIHRPKVLLLDEPTTGVDPVSRKEFWQILSKLKKEGISILVSTPYMDEASFCDRIALIQEGNILTIDTPNSIANNFSHPLYAVKGENMYQLLIDLRQYPSTISCFSFGDSLHLTLDKELNKDEIMRYLTDKSHINVEINTIKAQVEDCFMALGRNEL